MRALSAYTAVLSSGGVAGQVIGGVLVTANLFGAGWRPVFLVNVPIGAVVLAPVPLLVPAGEPDGSRRLDLAVLRAPGLAPGLAAVAILMTTHGGFLFSLTLHLQAGLGDSALRAGLGFAAAVSGYLAISLVAQSGGSGGWPLQAALVATAVALALGFSPLVTHALVRVPLRRAADASALLTTMIQLGQAIGVATFGSLYLTLDARHGPAAAAVSGHALAVTFGWLAAAMAAAVLAVIPLARTVAAARRA